MKKCLVATVAAVLLVLTAQVWAAPRHAGGYHPGAGQHGWRPGWVGGHWGPRIGIYYGGLGYGYGYGFGYGYPYAYPYGYAPIVIRDETLPQVLIQQDAQGGATAQSESPTHYWYYCTQPAGYFPYVQNCSQAWVKVVPQAPSNQPTAPRAVP